MNLDQLKIYSASGRLPGYATDGSSGFDLFTHITEDSATALDSEGRNCIHIEPGKRQLISTGLYVDLPPNYEIQVRPRSGLTFKHIDVFLGTIDSDYRGDIRINVANNSKRHIVICDGQRIAQGVLAYVPKIKEFIQVSSLDELSTTIRGTNGFGSTGL